MNHPAPNIAIVASRFNEGVTERLLTSCLKTLREGGTPANWVVRVPGAFELPWAVRELALSGRFDVVACLGCIIQGQTDQSRHLARATMVNLQNLSIETGVPIVAGIITAQNEKLAMARTRGKLDRGMETAKAALEMARLKRDLHRTAAVHRHPHPSHHRRHA